MMVTIPRNENCQTLGVLGKARMQNGKFEPRSFARFFKNLRYPCPTG
jgi:hypothetical protein